MFGKSEKQENVALVPHEPHLDTSNTKIIDKRSIGGCLLSETDREA